MIVHRTAPGVVGQELKAVAIALVQLQLQPIVVGSKAIRSAIQVAKFRHQPARLDWARARARRIDGRVAYLFPVGRSHVAYLEAHVVHQLLLDREVPLVRVWGAVLRILRPAPDRRRIAEGRTRVGDREIRPQPRVGHEYLLHRVGPELAQVL